MPTEAKPYFFLVSTTHCKHLCKKPTLTKRMTADTVNTANLVDSSCSAFDNKTGSQFTVTGRGGLPRSPDETFAGDRCGQILV